ncbi:disulfide bond formation protein B, partial [Oleiphilus sp. HI0125]
MQLSNRLIGLAIIVTSVSLVLVASYVEPFASMNPCPMCMMQRAIYLCVGGFALLALLAAKHAV